MQTIQEQSKAFLEIIKQYETIIIHRHVRPDPDAIGSQLALKQILQSSFPSKKICAAGTSSKGLQWLGEMDTVEKEMYEDALVIICDTANQERIDGKNYSLGHSIIKIDHHPIVDEYGDLQIVYPDLSSTSELITVIVKHLPNQLQMSDEAAKLLYAGIVGDTGRFMYKSTLSQTFLMTAWLKTFNFDAFAINDRFNVMSIQQAKFQGYILDNIVFTDHGVAYVKISKENRLKFGITEEETNSVVQLPGRIEGIYCWVVFVELEGSSKKWRARIRSKGPAINQIAQKYEGGGHPLASGANANGDAEISAMIEDLDNLVQEYKKK